ncbi:MAG: class B sortase [Lachnospiraceae bacterium]|nr:class B sortase [Lachnospiraceae bacterium]
MGKWCIGKIEFASKEDYKAGCRDLKRIQTLVAGVELDDYREAAELDEMLKKQPFLFESDLGRAFRGYLKDKADGIRHPRGNFPEECLTVGKAAKKKKVAAPKATSREKDGRAAMRAGRMKLRERDIGREKGKEEKVYGQAVSGARGGSYSQRLDLWEEEEEDGEDYREASTTGSRKDGRRKKKKKRVLKPLCILAGFALILFSLYKIFSYDILSYISERKMEELASCILTQIKPEVSEAHRIADLIASGMYTEEEAIGIAKREQEEKQEESVTEDGILYRYSVLYGRNPEMAGWIQLEGTVINYPVMLTPEDEEYYLKKGFDRKYDINGIPFMDARCSVREPTTNFLIYGHNMKNGSMFSALLSYEQEEFYREHKTIRFDTVYERGEYEIVGVFRTQVPYETDQEAYRYYSFIDTQDKEEYNAYIRYVKEQSFYETGIEAEYGTQLLTLSTCDRSIEAGRFVVVARKK